MQAPPALSRPMDFAILFGLILANGLFAMSEIALVTSRRARLQRLATEGDRAAVAAIELGDQPTRFLSTIQIGITSIGILSGIFGETALATPFALWMQEQGIEKEASEFAATALVVLVITYFAIVFGELVPKRIGQISPEPIARLVARPMLFLAWATSPFVRLLSLSTDLLLKLLGVKTNREDAVTEEEIHAMIAEGSDAGVIEKQEHAMLRNVFRLDERQLGSLMVPRSDIAFLDIEDPAAVNLRKVQESSHARFPVVKGDWDEVLGIASSKDLLVRALDGRELLLEECLQPALFLPESVDGMELVEHFRSSHTEIGLVVDEYGEIIGLVTMRDVIEAITGEFKPASAEEAWAVRREDGSWLLDGLIPVPELKDRLGLATVPEEDRHRYHSLSGMFMLLLGHVPKTGDCVHWEDWRFEVVDMDGKRIDKVLAVSGASVSPGVAMPPP